MKTKILSTFAIFLFILIFTIPSANGQIGTRFPSEKKVVTDPVTGTQLTFLTSKPAGDSKIYQTHNQWTADGNWVIFRSNRVRGEAMAVNEKAGDIVQVSEGGYTGMLNVARKSMKLYFMRNTPREPESNLRGGGPVQVIEVDLAKLFADSESKFVIAVPFQIGHIQTNPWVPGEIVFCWETGGKAPQRTWTVMADGSGLRPLYPESEYEWVTHEAVISKDEVAIAIMGHRKVGTGKASDTQGTTEKPADPKNPGQEPGWGPSGTREKPTGLGIVNLRTREMTIAGQTPSGSGLWHVNGSSDGRWAVGDDFKRGIYLIDRHTHEMILLSAGHKETASDHPYPTFNADGTKIEIQSAMLSEDNKSMNICIIPIPDAWLKRKY